MLLNLNPQKKTGFKQNKSTENILARVNIEMEADLTEMRKQKEVLMLERNSLLDSLKRTNEEFILLKKKRIQDVSAITVYYTLYVGIGTTLFAKLIELFVCELAA